MPDFENIIDDLRVHIAQTPEEKAFEKGRIEGKAFARIEIMYVFIVVATACLAYYTFA